jgi:hypothetical protein
MIENVFAVQFGLSFAVYGLLVWWFVIPYLRSLPARTAMIVLLLPHIVHHVGLATLVPSIVAPDFPRFFAWIVGIGDTTILALALVAMNALRKGSVSAFSLLWVFTAVGAIYNAVAIYYHFALRPSVAGQLGAHWYVDTFYVPLLLLSHMLVFWNLMWRGAELRRPARYAGSPAFVETSPRF